VDAIWVSNHGGRQLDTGPATIWALPGIKQRLKSKKYVNLELKSKV
jgi:isopentenyl diphosphate isomerase/L-lactate dehydrogenase-like FMN-dependent dehydrogenase